MQRHRRLHVAGVAGGPGIQAGQARASLGSEAARQHRVPGQEMLWIRRKILGASTGANARFTFKVQQGQIVGGGQLKGYMNPFAMSGGPQEIPIMVHPNMPPGTVLFLSDSVPYALNNITNVLQIRTRRDYYQTEWPRRTRAYEYGVYTDQVLQNFFMPGMYVLTNLSAA